MVRFTYGLCHRGMGHERNHRRHRSGRHGRRHGRATAGDRTFRQRFQPDSECGGAVRGEGRGRGGDTRSSGGRRRRHHDGGQRRGAGADGERCRRAAGGVAGRRRAYFDEHDFGGTRQIAGRSARGAEKSFRGSPGVRAAGGGGQRQIMDHGLGRRRRESPRQADPGDAEPGHRRPGRIARGRADGKNRRQFHDRGGDRGNGRGVRAPDQKRRRCAGVARDAVALDLCLPDLRQLRPLHSGSRVFPARFQIVARGQGHWIGAGGGPGQAGADAVRLRPA